MFEMAEMRRQHKLKQKRAVGEDGEKAEEQIASIKAMAAVSATTVEEQMARDRNAAEQQKALLASKFAMPVFGAGRDQCVKVGEV